MKIGRDVVIADGFYVNKHTGLVFGRHLELDSHNGCSAPLYCYNRSWRFTALFNTYSIALEDQYETLQIFEALENIWEREKKKYNRVYFRRGFCFKRSPNAWTYLQPSLANVR